MNFEDNFFFDSGFLTQNVINGNSNSNPNSISNINSNPTYGPMLAKYDYIQQPTSLAASSASSSFSSGSSSSSSSGATMSETLIPTSPMVKEEDYEDDGLDLMMPLPLPPKAKPPSFSKSSGSGVRKSNQGGRKRSIIFEQEEAEIQRKEFLERNRIAASKCRQKKKRWMKGLETNYEKLSSQNHRLRSMVMIFQEEVNSLKTELLNRNGLCSCSDMRTYFYQNNDNNNNTLSTMDPRSSISQAHYAPPPPESMPMPSTSLPSVAPPEPSDFLPANTLPPLSLSLPPYLNE